MSQRWPISHPANFAAVRTDRPLRFDPSLGDLSGRLATVELLSRSALKPEEKAIFFTLDWILGGGIAIREMAHPRRGRRTTSLPR